MSGSPEPPASSCACLRALRGVRRIFWALQQEAAVWRVWYAPRAKELVRDTWLWRTFAKGPATGQPRAPERERD